MPPTSPKQRPHPSPSADSAKRQRLPLGRVGGANESETTEAGDVPPALLLLMQGSPALPLLPEHLEAPCAEAWATVAPAPPPAVPSASVEQQVGGLRDRLDAALAAAVKSAGTSAASMEGW